MAELDLIRYNENSCEHIQPATSDEALVAFSQASVNWLNLGTQNRELVELLGKACHLHHMLVADILDARHLPKFEDFDSHCSLSLKMLSLDEKSFELEEEHLTIVLSQQYVLTFQEDPHQDVFDSVRNRLFENLGRIRRSGSDYLTYRLLDAVVVEYMHILEKFRQRIEDLGEKVLEQPQLDMVGEVVRLKKQVGILRKYTLPLKEEVMYLKGENIPFVQNSTRTYLRDVFDNLVFLATSFDTLHDMLRDILELQSSAINHSTNQIMKTLTILSSVFIPLTFVVGVYGMNFSHMPELQHPYGYPVVMGVMLLLALSMWMYMRHRKWL